MTARGQVAAGCAADVGAAHTKVCRSPILASNLAQAPVTSRPMARRTTSRKNAPAPEGPVGVVFVRLPVAEHEAVMAAATASGVSANTWARAALRTVLASQFPESKAA